VSTRAFSIAADLTYTATGDAAGWFKARATSQELPSSFHGLAFFVGDFLPPERADTRVRAGTGAAAETAERERLRALRGER
jgi:hypothetical protein